MTEPDHVQEEAEVPPPPPENLTRDGKARRKPGPPKGTGGRPPRRTTGPRSTSSRRTDYRPGVKALIQLAATPLVVLGQKSEAFLADAAALTLHADPLAEGINAAATEDPRVAAVLDRVLSVGPYAALIAPVVSLAVQCAANHKAIPEDMARGLGALKPTELFVACGMARPEPAAA